MAITCALTPEQLESLYSVVYADLKLKLLVNNKNPEYKFDFQGYMKSLYNDLVKNSDQDTVLNFMQMVPQMAANVGMLTPFLRGAKFDFNELADFATKYTDPKSGFESMKLDLGLNISAEEVRKNLQSKQNTKDVPEAVVNISPERVTELEFRYKATNGATTTTQEFVEQDPSQVEVEIQDQDKRRLYNVITQIESLKPNKINSVNYPKEDGSSIKIMLKTIKLSRLSSDQRYDYSNKFIARANAIKDQGSKTDEEVLSPDEIVSLVITDANGDYVYFDTEGNITDKNNGKIVYSLMRSARKENGKYVVRDVYNKEDMILSAEDQVAGMMRRDKTITKQEAQELYEEIEADQQKQFKELYEVRQQVIKGKNFILPITDVSLGVFNKKVFDGTTGPLQKALAEFPEDVKSFSLETITTHNSDFGEFKKGETSILIGDERFLLDRPLITTIFANKVAAALTDPKISNAKKIEFYNQFFDKDAKLPNTNKDIIERDGKLYLKYTPLSKKEFHYNNQKQLKLMGLYTGDLNGLSKQYNKPYQEALKQASLEQGFPSNDIIELDLSSSDAYSTVQSILMNGNVNISNEQLQRLPARIIYNGYNLSKSEIFNDYDVNNPGQFTQSNYLDFLLSDQVNITIALPKDSNLPMYNRYLYYSLPSELNTKIEKADKDINETEFVVDVYKGDRIVQHTYFTKGGKYYSTLPAEEFEGAMLPVTQEITEEEFDSAYVNALTNKTLASTTEPKGVDTEIQETKDNKTPEQKAEDRKSSIIEKVADPNKNHPLDTKGISKKFKFKRKASLPQGVTKSQIEAAEKWWNDNKVLQKYISFDGQLNIINSDAFATFFRAGEHLIKQSKFGKIELYQNGNWVDMYHESWHAFSQLFLTPEEQVNLYVEVINKVKKFSNLRKKDRLDDEDYLEVEEYLAEEFRAYAKNPKAKKDAPVRNSLFRRILNYLKAVFGKVLGNFRNTEMTNDVMEVEMVKKMFDNLYLSSEDPSKLNQYLKNVSPDNIRFDSLNRGIKQVGDRKSDALNRQDSNLISQSIDSMLSKFTDDIVSEAKIENQGKTSTNKKNKSAILELFTDPENRDIAYQLVKEELEQKLNNFRSQLGSIGTVNFNNLKDIADLRQNAVATIFSRKGDNKYIFLRSQIDDFSALNLDTKEGLREKGKIYYGIKIVGDFYSHKKIKDKTKDFADIIIVDDLQQAALQYNNYLNRIGADENVNINGFEINDEVFSGIRTELTVEQEELLDKIRIIQTALNNWGDVKKGVIKYHLENTTFDINKQVYKDVDGVEEMVSVKEDDIDFESEQDEEDKADPEKEVQDTYYGAPEGIKPLTKLSDPEVLYVIKSLFNIENGDYTYNRLGFRELANFKNSWNIIARTLENIKDPQDMYNVLKEASLEYPELKQLVESKIPNPSLENSESEYNITTSFFRAFNKHRVRYLQLYAIREGKTFVTEVINSSIDISNVKRVFQAKFKAELDSPYVYRDKNVTKLNLDKIVKDFSNDKGNLIVNKSFDFLNAIGFYYDPRLGNKDSLLRKEIEKNPNKFEYYGLPWIFDAVKKINALAKNPKASKEQLDFIDTFIQDPIQILSEGIPPRMVPQLAQGTIQKTAIDRLLELEITYGTFGSSYSVLNPKGDKVHEHTPNNSASMGVDAINNAKKLSDLWSENISPENVSTNNNFSNTAFLDPRINSWTKRSALLKAVFNFTDSEMTKRRGRSLDLMMVSGTQVNDRGEKSGNSTASLDEHSKYLQEFHTMLKSGVQEFLRPGSKSSSFGVRLIGGFPSTKRKEDPNLYIDVDQFLLNEAGESEAIQEYIIPYIAAEVERIRRYQEIPDAKNYVGFNRSFRNSEGEVKAAGESFVYFDTMLRPETKQRILDAVPESTKSLESALKTDADLLETIITDVSEYFESTTQDDYNTIFTDISYVDPSLLSRLDFAKDLSVEEKTKALVKVFNYNGFIHNTEMTILFNGDLAQFEHDKEGFHKRTSGLISNGDIMRTDRAAQDFINNVWNKRNTYAKSRGSSDFVYNATLNTAVISDPVKPSAYLKELEEGFREDYNRRYKNLLKSNPSAAKALIEKRVNQDLEPYKNMEEADGAGYITFDAYRTLRKLQGIWEQEHEDLYQKVLDAYNTGKEINRAEVVRMFPVYKLQHYGHLMNAKLPVVAMHKFALTPIIPTVFRNSDLERIHNQMIDQGIQYVTFATGSKVGAITSNGQPDVIFEDDNTTLKSNIKFTPNVINVKNIKEATPVPDKYKGQVVFMTQMRKMISNGLKESGLYTEPKFKQLFEAYQKSIGNYRSVIEESLKEQYGVTKNSDGSFTIRYNEKLLKLIHRELDRKNLPDHLISSLSLNRRGVLRIDPSIHIESETIEGLIFNVVKKLINQKMKGESLVQVPSALTRGMISPPGSTLKKIIDGTEEARQYLGSTSLPYYRRVPGGFTKAAKCAIALQGDFENLLNLKHLDGNTIETIDRLNEMVKEEEWLNKDNNRKAVTVTGVRIPTQSTAFMQFLEVYHFLPKEAGPMVILPSEVVIDSGSDYDVDKVTLFMPNINSDGSYVTLNLTQKQFEDQIEALRREGKTTELNNLLNLRKQSVQNVVIDNVVDMLKQPEFYAALVRPTGTNILKPEATAFEEIKERLLNDSEVLGTDGYSSYSNPLGYGPRYHTKEKLYNLKAKVISPTKTLTPRYNARKHIDNLVGKTVLGIVANQTALSPVYNAIGAKMPKQITIEYKDRGKNKISTNPIRLLLNHNKTSDGAISISELNTADYVENIAEIYSDAMNGAVDVETDPWIKNIEGNVEMINVLMYLFESGVPVKEAIAFMTNPLTRKYAAKQRIIKSEYGRMAGLSDPNVKKQAAAQVLKEMIPSLRNDTSQTIDVIKFDWLFKNQIFKNASAMTDQVLGDNNLFTLDKMNKIRSKGTIDNYGLAMFLHYLEIEQYIADNIQVKMLAKPDTKVYGSPQEVAAVTAQLNLLERSGNVDPQLIKKLRDDSLLSSFFDYDFGIALTKGLMPGINNSRITQYIQDLLSGEIKDNAGNSVAQLVNEKYKGSTGTQRFVKEYKNAIRNFVYQNFLTNSMNEKGDLVNLPTSFRGMPVVLTKQKSARGIKLENGKFYINESILENDFKEKKYLGKKPEDKTSYYSRKLPFFNEDVFDSKSSFFKYLLEREYLRKIYSIDSVRNTKEYDRILNLAKDLDDFNSNKSYYEQRSFEEYLSRIALINTFNRHAIMKQSEASYTQRVIDAVEEMKKVPGLTERFPILNQITSFKDVRGNYVLTLNDRDILEGQLAEIYHQNLTELADINIKKAKNPDENKRITDLFKMFSKVLIYQHGVGKPKYGINQALPQEEYEMIMSIAFPVFIDKHMDRNSLTYVLNKLLGTDLIGIERGTAFKDYTVRDINLYNSADVQVEVPMDEEDIVEDKIPTTVPSGFDVNVTTQPTVSTTNNPAEFTNHSGGAIGADSMFDTIGKEYGQTDHKHYYYGNKTPKGNVLLTEEQVEEGIVEMNKAATILGRKPSKQSTINLLARNWFQVKNSTQIVAIAPIDSSMKFVEGGTGWAVAMGQANDREIHVFNLNDNSWYTWNGTSFVSSNVPVLAKDFAGIGSRQDKGKMTPESVQAIRDVYENTFKPTTQPQAGVEPITPVDPTVSTQPQTSEKKEGEYEFAFSDGFKVYTPFELNTQQKNALLSLEHFAKNPKDFQSTITLSGYAGTGKTTIMSLFTEYLDNTLRSYKLTSPTHRANTVTKSKNPNKSVDTLAKTFGLKPTLNIQTPGTYSKNDLVWNHKKRGRSILQPGDYLIIDESSMVTDDLFKMITDATNDMDLKIIYMGDAGQAEPVQGRSGVSKVFLGGRQIELTQVERTGDNPILYESTRLRTPKEDVSGISAEREGKGVLFVNQNNFSEISAILNTEINNLVYGENPLSFRVLAATNSAVQQYNLRSRYSLFQDKASDILHKGEIMMGYGMVLQGDDEIVANSVDYKVLNVIDGQSSIDIAYKNNGTVVKEKINVRGKKVELQNIYTDEVSDMFILDHTVDQENAGKLAYALVYYKNEESNARQRGDKEKRAIMQDKAAEIENSYVFMTNVYVGTNGDYSSGIHLEPINNKKLNQRGMNSAPSIMKTLDYGYAHTIHKSQGGTYNKIMILEDSIDVYEAVKIKYKKEEESIEDIENSVQKLKYVAVSRASDYVYYISTPSTIKSTTSYSKEKQERKPSSPGPSTPSQTNIPVSNAKVTKSGTMSFQYQGFQTADLERMGITNTFDAILAGKRTSTTRYVNTSKETFEYWADTKVGDVIEFWSGKKTGEGRSVKVEVTNIVPIDWTQMNAEDVADWTAKEGWDGYKLWDDHQKKGYKGIQIQFRILGTPTQRKNMEDDNAEDDNNLTCNPF